MTLLSNVTGSTLSTEVRRGGILVAKYKYNEECGFLGGSKVLLDEREMASPGGIWELGCDWNGQCRLHRRFLTNS